MKNAIKHSGTLFLYTSFLSLLFLASSCIQLDGGKSSETMPDLTTDEMIKMTPEEVAAYYAKKSKLEQEKAEARKQASADDRSKFWEDAYSRRKRERLGDMNMPLENTKENTVFPWRDSDANRSESLLDKTSAIYDW